MDELPKRKNRKEVLQEVMEKSKAYSFLKKEINQRNEEIRQELDEDYQNLLQNVKYRVNKNFGSTDELPSKGKQKGKDGPKEQTYEELMMDLRKSGKNAPIKATELTEKEKALARKRKLM